MKYWTAVTQAYYDTSLPVLGAWIEIKTIKDINKEMNRRSLYWERGLKFLNVIRSPLMMLRRSLYWERGLKYR